MILILEGPDGSGKSTLAKQLAASTGYKIIHFSKPETEEEKENMFSMYEDVLIWNRHAILDRCWYSEMVYGEVMRGGSCISTHQMYELEDMMAGALLIYCTGPRNTLWDRCKKRGEEYITSWRTFNEICDGYDMFMRMPHKIPVVTYEYKNV